MQHNLQQSVLEQGPVLWISVQPKNSSRLSQNIKAKKTFGVQKKEE